MGQEVPVARTNHDFQYMSGRIIFIFLSLLTFHSVSAQDISKDAFLQRIDSLYNLYYNSETVADTLESVGISYYKESKLDAAMAYFIYVLAIRDTIQSPKLVSPYLYLGSIAGRRNELSIAKEYFRKAEQYAEEFDSPRIGAIYNNLGKLYTETDQLDTAIYYLRKALDYKIKVNDSDIAIATTYNNLGTAYLTIENLDSANYFLQQARKRSKDLDDKREYVWAINNIGFIKYSISEYDSAVLYYEKALPLAERDSILQPLAKLYSNLFDAHYMLRDDTALYYREAYLNILGIIEDEEADKRIEELRTQYELVKAETQIKEQEFDLERQRSQIRLYLIIGGGLILLLSGFLIFLSYRQKIIQQLRKKDEAIHNQQVNDIIRKQELSVLNARVEGQDMERQRIAEDLHDRLGSKLSAVKLYYDSVQVEQPDETILKAKLLLDETIDETRRIAHNLSSGVLSKFGLIAAVQNLKETLENSKRIEIEFFANGFENHSIPKKLEENFYRIIQELVSNILKHAKATQITIQLTRHEDGMITLMVEDNGVGFNPDKVSLNSMGLMNLKNRVKRFDGQLSVDSDKGSGTTVIVEIDESKKPSMA